MSDPLTMLTIALAAMAAMLVAIAALLKGWQGWLELKRAELAGPELPTPVPAAGARIELADLKERVRRLEAIANGVEG